MISLDQLHAFVCILTHSCVSKVKHESDRNEFSYPILPIQNLEIKVKGQCHIVIQTISLEVVMMTFWLNLPFANNRGKKFPPLRFRRHSGSIKNGAG